MPSLHAQHLAADLLHNTLLAKADHAIHFINLATQAPRYAAQASGLLLGTAYKPSAITPGRLNPPKLCPQPVSVSVDGLAAAHIQQQVRANKAESQQRNIARPVSSQMRRNPAARAYRPSSKGTAERRPVSGSKLDQSSELVRVGRFVEIDRQVRKQFEDFSRAEEARQKLLDDQHQMRVKEVQHLRKMRQEIQKCGKSYAIGFCGQVLEVNPRGRRRKLFTRIHGKPFLEREARESKEEPFQRRGGMDQLKEQALSVFNSVIRNSIQLQSAVRAAEQQVSNEEYNNYYQRQVSHIPVIQLEPGTTITEQKAFHAESLAEPPLLQQRRCSNQFQPFRPSSHSSLARAPRPRSPPEEQRDKPKTQQGKRRVVPMDSRPNTSQGGRYGVQTERGASKAGLNSTKASFIEVHNVSLADSVVSGWV